LIVISFVKVLQEDGVKEKKKKKEEEKKGQLFFFPFSPVLHQIQISNINASQQIQVVAKEIW